MDDEQLRIRGYLQTQAAKLSLPELTAKVRSDMEQLHAAIGAIPAGRMHDVPAAGGWSANDVLGHLTETSRRVAVDIAGVLDEGRQPGGIADALLPAGLSQDGLSWWTALLGDREPLLARVNRASGDEHLGITWDHPFFGPLNWREWVLFLRLHDLDHARQLRGIAEAL